jgi:hypothetical protein
MRNRNLCGMLARRGSLDVATMSGAEAPAGASYGTSLHVHLAILSQAFLTTSTVRTKSTMMCGRGRAHTLLVLNLGLHVIDRVRRLDFQGNRLTSKSFHKNLHCES